MSRRGILIVLSGPSGAGKGTVVKELLRSNPDLSYSVSLTTRPPRFGEINGVNYWFVSKDEFMEMVENDELLEFAQVYDNYYGTPRRFVEEILNSGRDVILEIDIQGAMQIKQKFSEGVFIFILPPTIPELMNRIVQRGSDSQDSIRKRLGSVYDELKCAYNYQYVVVNDVLTDAVGKIASIIIAEKCRTERNCGLIETICRTGQLEWREVN